MSQPLQLRSYMLTHPVTVRPDATMGEAIKLILDNKISGLCVVDESQRLVGILSELDCLHAMLSAGYDRSQIGLVSDFMAADNLVVANPREHIVDVAQDMLLKKKRRRPVVEDGRLVGQVTCRQLLKAARDFTG